MKNKLIFFLSLLIVAGCDNAESGPDCSLVLCDNVSISIRIKYVDKTTGEPLFSEGSMHTPDDLKITLASNFSYTPVVQVDSNDHSVVVITPLMGGELLKLGSLPSDKITIQTRAAGKECCAGVDIISLKINDETICAPCNDLNGTTAVIKK